MRDFWKLAAVWRRLQLLSSAILLVAFFLPWARGVGGSVSALGLRKRLEAPHRLSSLVTRKGRITRDYQVAGRLWMLGAAEGVALASALWPPLTAWPGLITGVGAAGGAMWARHEIGTYPFQRPGSGETLTLLSGCALFAASCLRLRAELKSGH